MYIRTSIPYLYVYNYIILYYIILYIYIDIQYIYYSGIVQYIASQPCGEFTIPA